MTEILIVEDNVEFRSALAETLQARFPYVSVSQAGDALEAFQMIRLRPPGLIFMDLRLPGPGGLELTRAVKRYNPSVKVIVLTQMDSPEYREAALQSGADFFLSKESEGAEAVLLLLERVMKGDPGNQPLRFSRLQPMPRPLNEPMES